jgi:hypothetical protein
MIWRAVNAVMSLLFVICVVLQFNDPDPIRWSAIYGAAAVLSGWAVVRPDQCPWYVPALVALISLVWAATIAPRVFGVTSFDDLFKTMKAESPQIEEAREMGGLLIVGVWMAVIAIHAALARAPR